jgi:hypothetical protein
VSGKRSSPIFSGRIPVLNGTKQAHELIPKEHFGERIVFLRRRHAAACDCELRRGETEGNNMKANTYPITVGMFIAIGIATGIYGRHLETEMRRFETEFRDTQLQLQNATSELRDAWEKVEALKKWNQNRMESLQRQILELRSNTG